MANNPADTNLRGNLGVMLYYNAYWDEAVEQLSFVVKGGLTKEGTQLEPIQLVPNLPRVAEYYYTYAFGLSRLDQCGEALHIAQLIISRIPADEYSVEKANEIIARCQQNLTAPLISPTPDSALPAEATPTP